MARWPTGLESAADRTWLVLATSAVVGFGASVVLYPMWTDNVESAQVVSGVVRLPPGNVMAAYHTSVESLQILVPALMLRLGISEWPLCLASIGVQGAISFSAIALLALAVSGSAAVSVAIPVLLLFVRRWAPPWPEQDIDALHGHHYPILFPAHASIFGVVGFFLLILIVALFALGKRRAACGLAGLLPGVHAGFAPPALLALVAGAFFAGRGTWPEWRDLRWFVAGLAISLLLIAGQSFLIGAASMGPTALGSGELVESFHALWDEHNRPLSPGEWASFFEPDLYFLVVVTALLASRRKLSTAARFVLWSLGAIELAGLLFMLVLDQAPSLVPSFARYLIIGRLLNLSSVSWFCIAMAVLGGTALRERGVAPLLVFAAFVWLILSGRMRALTGSSFASLTLVDLWQEPRGILVPVGLVLCFAVATLGTRGWLDRRYPHVLQRPLSVLVAGGALAALGALVVANADRAALAGRDEYSTLTAKIAKGDGLLLTPLDTWVIGRVQLRTRRGLLLDLTQLNLIGKVPSTASAIESILNDAHCATLLDPSGYATFEKAEACWSGRSLDEWQSLRQRLGVHDVLVDGDLQLGLPETYRGRGFGLYHIPEATPAVPAEG